MKKYTYRFTDGTINTVEITDALYDILTEMDSAERKNNRTETRRHISLSVLSETSSTEEDLAEQLIVKERVSIVRKAIKFLSAYEQKLIDLYYFQHFTLQEVAQKFGVQKPAICKRLTRILGKLRKILQNMETFPHSRGI